MPKGRKREEADEIVDAALKPLDLLPNYLAQVEAPPENSAQEIKRLQRCINDLVSLLSLPALWHGGDSSQIVRTLLEALLGIPRLDFIYVRLNDQFDATPIETVRVARSQDLAAGQQQIPDILSRWVAQDP